MAKYDKEALDRAYEVSRRLEAGEKQAEKSPTRLASWIWDQCELFFTVMFASVWSGFIGMADTVYDSIFKKTMEFWQKTSRSTIDVILGFMYSQGLVDKDDAKSLTKIRDLYFPFNVFLALMTMAVIYMGWLKTKSETMLGTARQTLNVIHSPLPPSPHEILQAAFVAPERTADVRDGLQRAGLSKKDIDLMFLGMYRIYSEDVVRVLWLRGVLNDDQMYMRMRELGYTDTRTKEIIQGWPIIPGPSDLFHLVAKEAFEPKMIELMGLGDEFPVDQLEWLTKQGISKEWAEKYWYAHWDQPSIGMGFEMLHRDVIGVEELDMLFRTVEIPPYWRDKLTQIAFKTYTRVDTRRMHDLGVLNDDELVQSYKDQGYNQKKAEKMALFTIRFNQMKDKELTMGQVLKGFNEYLIERDAAKDLLIQIDYSEPQAEYLIIFEEYKREKEYQDEIVKQLGERYQNNLIEELDVRNRLGQLNLPGKQVELLIERWKLKRFLDVKLPSKSDLDKFMKAKIINEDIYRMEMTKIGYGFNYVSWYLALAKGKRS
ncbi:hypothetical protein ES703_32719 [subsurface metagenome]